MSDSPTTDSDDESAHQQQTKTYLSLCCFHGKIAAAYYDPVKAILYILEDTADYWGHFDLAKLVIDQVSPTLIITSSKSDVKFIQAIRDWCMSPAPFEWLSSPHAYSKKVDSHPAPPKLLIRPKREFNYEAALERLLSLELLLDQGNANDQTRDPHFRWAARVRLNNFSNVEVCSGGIAAAGALLEFLSRQKGIKVQVQVPGLEDVDLQDNLAEDEAWRFDVRRIECLSLEQTMHLNVDTLTSIGVFAEESHASIHTSRKKEGLSLFGLISPHIQTAPGKRLLKHWLLRPSLSLQVINARLDAVQFFGRLEHGRGLGKAAMKGIGSVHSAVFKLSSGLASVKEWNAIRKCLESISILYDSLLELGFDGEGGVGEHSQDQCGEVKIEVVEKLFSVLDISALRKIGSEMNEIIDWEESHIAARMVVRPHVDEELDEWKMMLSGLDSLLSNVAMQIATQVPPDYAESLNVVYFPQLGFLICVPLRPEWQNEDGVHIPEPPSESGEEFVYQFFTEQSAYFKSRKMHDLDEHIGDLHPAIVDREIEIMHALEEKFLCHKEMILAVVDVCAELDCLLAFGQVSRMYDYVRPGVVEENILDIREGRHPLHEQVVDTFVANDLYVVGEKGAGGSDAMGVDDIESTGQTEEDEENSMRKERSIVICTGANACGKSVYLKQAALIVFMAQIGCFVPASYAKIGIVDKIFGRIQTRESVTKVQSAFMIDLNQVSLALRNMTPRSLLIIDEFGKGTLAADGAGLFCGLVKYLLELGPQCPRTLIATHFHEVFRDDEELISPSSLPISFVHMQILLTGVDWSVIDVENGGEEEDEEGDAYGGLKGNAGALLQQGESITYLYKATPGLCLNSYAAQCALAFGIPTSLVNRARKVTDAVTRHAIQEIVDEKMTAEEEKDLEDAEGVCRRFLQWDLAAELERVERGEYVDVKRALRDMLGVGEEEEKEAEGDGEGWDD